MLHLSDDEILAYRDGEERSAALARHLGTCPSCRQKVHAAERLARLLRVAKAEPLFAASISSSSVPAAIPESAALTLIRAAQEDFQSRIPQTEALGILIVRDAASKGLGISYRKTAIDEQFLVAGEETRSSPLGAVDRQNPSFDPSAAYKTAPGADTVEFENSSLHITARIVAGIVVWIFIFASVMR